MFTSLVLGAALALGADRTPAADSVTKSDITGAYAALVRVVVVAPPGSTDSMVLLQVGAPPDHNLLAGFFRDHDRWLTYLVQNGRGFSLPGLDGEAPGGSRATPGHPAPSLLEQEFVRRLAADSQFNSIAVPAIAGYLRRHAVPVSLPVPAARIDTIPVESAVAVAVRFFYPDFIMQGHIMTHVCSVFNAVRELAHRNPALEALAYSAIMGDLLRGDSSRIGADFGPATELMNSLDSGAPDSVRLARAQGAMWAAMARSTRLREVLMAEADRSRDALPFVLSGP